MGGATVPTPGGNAGAMAFPSSAEPNPLLQGLRGNGPEQIINQIGTPAGAPPAPPSTPPTTAAPTAQGANVPYYFQSQTPGMDYELAQGYGFLEPAQQLGNQLEYSGYSNPLTGQVNVPQLPGSLGLTAGPDGTYTYNQSALQGLNLNPQYQPYSPTDPNASNIMGNPFQNYSSNYINYLNSNFLPNFSGGLNQAYPGGNYGLSSFQVPQTPTPSTGI